MACETFQGAPVVTKGGIAADGARTLTEALSTSFDANRCFSFTAGTSGNPMAALDCRLRPSGRKFVSAYC